jgi:hypothetical protein
VSPVRIWLAGLLIALGALWLLDAAHVLDAASLIAHWWPVAVIALGLVAAAVERRLSAGPLVLMAVGVLLLTGTLGAVDVGTVVWPTVAIVVGVTLLARRGPWNPVREETGDRQDVFAVLGSSKGRNRSQHFRHANVSALLGGATLDLGDAHPEPRARVGATAVLGGVDILVPPGWRVSLGGLPLFGGYEDRTRGDGPLPPDAPELRVVATAIFGGVTTKTAQPAAGRSSPGAPGG